MHTGLADTPHAALLLPTRRRRSQSRCLPARRACLAAVAVVAAVGGVAALALSSSPRSGLSASALPGCSATMRTRMVSRPSFASHPMQQRMPSGLAARAELAAPAGGEGGEAGEASQMPPGFWEYALRDDDLGRGQRRIIQVATPFSPQGGKKIIVARVGKEAGVYAFDYMCPHLGVSLADGKFGVTKEGLTIECSQHKSQFNIESGQCVDWLPGGGWNALQRMVTPACNLLTYPTLVKDGNIFVDMSKAKVRGSFEEWVEDRPNMRR